MSSYISIQIIVIIHKNIYIIHTARIQQFVVYYKTRSIKVGFLFRI